MGGSCNTSCHMVHKLKSWELSKSSISLLVNELNSKESLMPIHSPIDYLSPLRMNVPPRCFSDL